MKISEIMTKDLITVDPGTSLRDAARVMTQKWIRHLPVLQVGR
jgi:CBS domain-containing protein